MGFSMNICDYFDQEVVVQYFNTVLSLSKVIYIYMYIDIHLYIYTYIYVYIHNHTRTYICIYKRINMYISIYAYIHTYNILIPSYLYLRLENVQVFKHL
jgi:hypothetical protein